MFMVGVGVFYSLVGIWCYTVLHLSVYFISGSKYDRELVVTSHRVVVQLRYFVLSGWSGVFYHTLLVELDWFLVTWVTCSFYNNKILFVRV